MTVVTLRPRLDSPVHARRTLGEHMGSNVLDVIEKLLVAAQHPDIAEVTRYGPGTGPWGPDVKTSKVKAISGVKVTHQSGATASLWEAVWPGETPIPAPAPIPVKRRAPRLAVLAAQLLDVAKPAEFRAWRLVSLPDLGPVDEPAVLPYGLSIALADGTKALLRASSTGARTVEPAEDPFPDYVIPEEVKNACRKASAATAAPE